MWGPEDVDLDTTLPICPGIADEAAVAAAARDRHTRAEILDIARRTVEDLGVDMEVLAIDLVESDDGRLIAVYFRAPRRVEFSTIVGPLARRLHARIDLRQLRGRDTARAVGGVGVCGRPLCCSTFLPEPLPVPNRLASEQSMASNPLAVTGACGKLMCCLRYESPYYVDFEAALGEASVPDGPGCPLVSACSRRRHLEHHDA
ncbi:hypothetical protein FYJ43_02415 [Cutibacterium sp. WCA-380-WT-3A]|uniref:PSP1 C-terminal domain-containing protein n=1 Tax=Cutibacterium porci TaxID=2605781 RepID=A0A7K0J4R4_9ACTN|nr:hypothetical protein [Cutibacterium porci]